MVTTGTVKPPEEKRKRTFRLLAPQKILMLASFIAFIVLFSSSQVIYQLPFYNVKISIDGEFVWIEDPSGNARQVLGLKTDTELLPINAKHLSADPDFMRSFEELETYFKAQTQLYIAFLEPTVTIALAGGDQLTLNKSWRSIRDLPATFWMLQTCGFIALLTGLAFWIYHRGKAVTRTLALAGIGCYVMQVSQSIYASREFVMHGELFQYLLHLNHFGGMLFVFSLVMLLWFYPNPLNKPRLVFLFSVITAAIWSNELVQWVEWPINLFYFPAIIVLIFTAVLLQLQWIRSRHSQQYRRLYLWLVYSILAGLGLTFLVYILPILFTGQPLVSTWLANMLCLLVFLGFVLGVHYGGLFSVERWWLKACLNVLLAVAIIAIDLFAITLLGAQAALGFSIIAVLCFWGYLVVRSKLWRVIAGKKQTDKALTQMMIDQKAPSESIIEGEACTTEIELINNLYTPLNVNAVEPFYSSPVVCDNGLKLCVSFPGNDSYRSYEVVGKLKGQQNFEDEDAELLKNVIEHAQSTERLHIEREATLLAERDRIMRDLHDEVAADLLVLTFQAETDSNRQQAQRCLKNLREIVYSMDDKQPRSLVDALANWRYEIAQLAEAASVELQWEDSDIKEDQILTGAQWLHLSRALRELAANAIKHASINAIQIKFNKVDGQLKIAVINEGVQQSPQQWKAGKGLKSIQRRIKELYGEVDWQVDNQQCQAQISIPL